MRPILLAAALLAMTAAAEAAGLGHGLRLQCANPAPAAERPVAAPQPPQLQASAEAAR